MSLDPARAFLYRVLPWGDPDVYVNIHWTVPRPANKPGRPFVNGQPCRTLDEACAAVQYIQTKARNAQDIYVCLSTQAEADHKTVNGRTFTVAARSQRAAVKLKALFIDIDVKEKGYATQAAAFAALKDFLAHTGLPAPTVVVQSGTGGMHLYWTLQAPLTVPEWQPLANALAEATRRAGLICDTQCTVDAARIMRVPGTRNFKANPPLPVTLGATMRPDLPVEVMRQALAPYMGATVIPLAPRLAQAGINSELTAGLSAEAKPVDLDQVAASCGFVKNAIMTAGRDYANPLWNLTTLIATFSMGGRTDAHRMASGHPDYTQQETDDLFDRKLRERQEKNLGWPSCSSVQNAGCSDCASCPLLAFGRSPLSYARQAASAAPVGPVQQDQDLPSGFVRDAQGLVYKRVTSVEGVTENRQILSYPLYGPWLQDEPWAIGFLTRFGNPAREHRLVVPSRIFQSNFEKLAIFVGELGMQIQHDQRTLFKEFLVSWTQHLQTIKGAVVPAASYGWSVVDGKLEGFCYGSRVWGPTGNRPATNADPILANQYSPRGEIAPWMEAARLITDQKRPALDVILATSFAAPLVRFTGATGLLISAYSTETGVGKSSAILVAQSVWGHPIRGVQSLDDTTNSVVKKLGDLKSLPMFWDELKTDEQTSKFVAFAFQLTQGKTKSRLSQDATLREVTEWQTILLAASNDSLMDFIARKTKTTPAGAVRVLEYTVPKAPESLPPSVAARVLARTHDNFGHAGLAYAQFLGANHARVAREVAAIQDSVAQKLKAGQHERFWVAAVACLWAGTRYSNEIGLTQIDEKKLVRFLFQVVERARSELKQKPVDMQDPMSVLVILGDYLSAMRARHTLTTNRIHLGRGRPSTKNPVEIVTPTDVSKLDTIHVQVGRDDKMLRIVSPSLHKWLAEHGYSCGIVVQAMKDQLGARQVNGGYIAAGTQYSHGAPQLLLEFTFAGSSKLAAALNTNDPGDDAGDDVTASEASI